MNYYIRGCFNHFLVFDLASLILMSSVLVVVCFFTWTRKFVIDLAAKSHLLHLKSDFNQRTSSFTWSICLFRSSFSLSNIRIFLFLGFIGLHFLFNKLAKSSFFITKFLLYIYNIKTLFLKFFFFHLNNAFELRHFELFQCSSINVYLLFKFSNKFEFLWYF